MLHWICPECGRECAPAARECPACADALQTAATPAQVMEQSTVTAGVIALAKTFREESPVAPIVPAPAAVLASTNGASSTNGHSNHLTEEELAIDSVVRPLVESAGEPVPTVAATPVPDVAESHEQPVAEAAPCRQA